MVSEQAEVAPERHHGSMLVVHLHAQCSVHRLRDFGNRGGRLVADLRRRRSSRARRPCPSTGRSRPVQKIYEPSDAISMCNTLIVFSEGWSDISNRESIG